ncbi:MAG: DUF1501 domain-containing protein [Thermoleophilia bacterium]|nr:DUF1501 domain-containing protein [Thermoleophilia bacterium]
MSRSPHRGCRDWHSTRRSFLGRATDVVPVPADAMDGLDAFAKSGGLTRRNLLERGVGLWIGAAALGGLSTRSVLEAATAQAQAAPDATILVSLYLDGGNDGLNTLVPLTDPLYRSLRSRVGIAPGTTLAIPGTSDFGWHPSLGGLKALYDSGKVAVLPSVDFADADQSHFNSAAYWRRGIVGPSFETAGWLGRTLDVVGTPDNPLQGISVNYSPDPVLASHRAATATVYDPNNFDFYIGDVWDSDGFIGAYRNAASGKSASEGLMAARRTYANAFRVKDQLAPLRVTDENPLPPVPVPYPDTDLGKGLQNLARMLGAGFGTRVAALSTGGFDTHDDQATDHAELLKDLGDSLLAWQSDLTARGLSSRVITMVWSEFGRRPEDNDSNGTDHGAGGLMMIVGDRANGGIRTEWPGLAQLDEDDNLRVTTEFRTVYATLLESWLGVEAARVLPKIDGARLPLIT